MPRLPTCQEKVCIDFGRTVALREVTLQLGTSTSDYPRGYTARVSETPLDFAAAVLASGTGQQGMDTAIVFANLAVGRYLLIAQTGTADPSWWTVAEANVTCSD